MFNTLETISPIRLAAWPANVSANSLDQLQPHITCTGDRARLPILAPFTLHEIATIPLCNETDVVDAVRRARKAQQDWALVPPQKRANVFRKLHDLVIEGQEEMLDFIQLESGKARHHAFEEIGDTALVARYYGYHGYRHLKPIHRRGTFPLITRTWEYRHPLGIVGLIAPWNYPLTLSITDTIPALFAGNAVILKPAEQTSFTALKAAELLYEAGLPHDLFQIITGKGETIGPPLINQVDFVGFTGSTEVGRQVAQHTARRLIPCSLELGGKNPMLVLHDANLDKVVEGAVKGCFANAGQLCVAFERIYVARPIFENFLARLSERVQRMTFSTAYKYEGEMGCLISPEQFDKVTAHIEDARAKGAEIVAGGYPLPDKGPLFYAPTILTDVTEEMNLARHETFGPVVSVYPFDDEDEAVRLANDTIFGLNASIWTRDVRRGFRLARQIEAGTVNINEPYAAAWASIDAPMGGFKDSGLGRRHGAQGIQKYTEVQTVASQHVIPLSAPFGISEHVFARIISRLFKIWRRLPGIR